MKKKHTKIAAAMAGVSLVAAMLLPFAATEVTAAKWFGGKEQKELAAMPQNESTEEEAVPAYKVLDDEKSEVQAVEEAVVVKANGEMEQVAVVEAADKPVNVDMVPAEELNSLQKQVEADQKVWLLDPVLVLKNSADRYGFNDKEDTFTLLSADRTAGVAKVLVGHGEKYYLVQLKQPGGAGSKKIWQVVSIQQVKTVIKNPPSGGGRVDIGPGVAGLDYSKVIKWQQDVDAGRDRWRLNPLEVARQEGKSYGFSDQDAFTIIRQYSGTSLARHGQIDMEVKHDGRVYTMILVKPFGGGDAIWTIYNVTGPVKPAPQPEPPVAGEKVLYANNKFTSWKWYDDRYLKDMSFKAVVTSADIKENDVLAEKLKAVDYRNKIVLAAYLGTAGGGYDIGIEKVVLNGNQLTVRVHTKSPAPGEMTTKNITFPADYVVLDRQIADVWGGLNVSFVDQNGKVLQKMKITIRH